MKFLRKIIFSIISISIVILFFVFFGVQKVELKGKEKFVLYVKNRNYSVSNLVVVKDPITLKHTTGRIAGLADMSILINEGVLYINGKNEDNDKVLLPYRVNCFTKEAEDSLLNKYTNLDKNELRVYYLLLTNNELQELEEDSMFLIKKDIIPSGFGQNYIFPNSYNYNWNKDYFGILKIPRKNYTIKLNSKTYSMYRITIENFEQSKIEKKGTDFFINNKKITSYTFMNNYVFILNDNRTNIDDSRKWGPIPENYIIGKILFSL